MYQDRKRQQLASQLNKLANLEENIKIKFAATSDEFIEAMQLIHKVYAKKGLLASDKKQPYFSPHLVLPNNRLVIATKNDRIIGTISLIEDSPIGVPMDNVHSGETTALRQQNIKFAEVGSFAIAPEYQHHGITLLLCKAVFLYVCSHRNIESILIAVHPRVAEVYKDLFRFEQIGMIQEYSTFNNAKSIPLKLDTIDAITAIEKNNIFSADSNGIRIEYLLHQHDEIYHHYVENRKNDFSYLPVWQESHIKKYFYECNINIKNLPEKQRTIISWLYPTLN